MTAARDRGGRRPLGLLLAWVFAIIFALIGAWVVLFVRRGGADVFGVLWSPALAVGFTTVGALIVAHQPGNTIGRICLAIGLVLGVQLAIVTIVALVDVQPGRLPASMIVVAFVADQLPFVGLASLAALLARFPNGRLPSRRWRIVDALVIAFVVAQAIQLFRPGELEMTWILTHGNPIAVEGVPVGLFAVAGAMAGFALPVALALGIFALTMTYRRSTTIVRAQIRWILSAAAAAVIGIVLLLVSNWTEPLATVAFYLVLLSPVLIPIGIGMAILRYRLYEIDRIVSRTIGYAAVTAVLALAFLGANLVLQAALAPIVRADTIVVAASTLLVAALFAPVRARTQRAVDRRFHRARFDSERLAASFAERLRDEVDLETLRTSSLATAAGAVEPARIALWLRRERTAS